MYTSAPSAEEMAAAGLAAEDYAGEVVEIWPENLLAYDVFAALGTQWRVGMGGATGLDYAAVPVVLRLKGVLRAEWTQLFEDLRVMESAALQTMRPA
ncbi:DUF1799 domain-containing protein [Massilia oculi]|uniref:DUF1799 domain-containing protein n=1 Tax=Massilia oculi TaxID=945844 RepID=A0A2S2DH81_9BURK|nr:DUF1799 domain-containing protein [Massilia oculi]AWL04226.1 hypothetical protein DIR46_07120 [Massilia oculi]